MNKVQRLKICNKFLGISLLLMLISAIQLEATSGAYTWSVWLHIALGAALTVLSVYHIYLHYKSSNWFARFAKHRSTATRIIWWIFLLTAVSGIAATALWLAAQGHTHIGALHGKIGFLMVIFAVIHHATVRRARARGGRRG